jgi:2-polyprenyl-3-methyl-5-hydroxy-6-metoxy-1,4-benzoquinol methylase
MKEEKETVRYIHEEVVHNLDDPNIIVPVLLDVLKPKSVVDVCCGIGTFLHVFKELGLTDILGLDGKWVDKDKLSKNIDIEAFKEIDIEKGITINKKFD